MRHKRSVSARGTGYRRKSIPRKVLTGVMVLIIFSLIPVIYVKFRGQNGRERRELRELYASGMFEQAYTQSEELLRDKPLDYSLLTIHGFSAYELAIAQINNSDTVLYVDECIWALRKALLLNQDARDGQIFYILGKAYYYKGPGYADLAVIYLEKARAILDRLGDIPEYLGLAYVAIRDFRSSVEAFALALTEEGSSTSGEKPSDTLLIAIANSYIALEEYDASRAYLMRCLETSKDFKAVSAARLLLGDVLFKTGDTRGAEAEFLKVIEENGGNAEAHFKLGEIYAQAGDTTRARAEWRRALRLDPAYRPAQGRLNS